MKNKIISFSKLLYIFLIVSCVIQDILLSEVLRPRGVSLSKASLYSPGKQFTCLDGTQKIPFSRVNDDYCDCYDASDEPGTAACPHGIFHCTNAGHKPLNIPSNRVNDGICDCCDGTDEYSSDLKCRNNCIELGKTAREEAQRMAELIKAGKQMRAEYIQKGAHIKQEKEAKLKELSKSKEEAEKIKTEKELLKKDAEDLESTALEYYRKLEEESKKRKAEEEEANNRAEAEQTFAKFDSNQDGVLDIPELQSRHIFDKNADGAVTEDEAKFFLNNQESVDIETFTSSCWNTIKPYMMMNAAEYKPPVTETKQDATESTDLQDDEDQDHEEEYQDEEEEQEDQEGEGPEPEESKSETSTLTYDDETQKLIDQANSARTEYQNADQQVRDIENEIKSIHDYLEKDYGPEDEYAVLQGQCFEFEDNEYIYKMCPFDKTSQQPKSSSSETQLGSWGKWSGSEMNKYEQMTFEKGQSCWNGPQRSTLVKVNCGGENKLTSVSEPNRCEYLFDFTTPAACRELATDVRDNLRDEL